MDSHHFDLLARLVGSGRSRRDVLMTLAGGKAGTALAAAGIESADAAKKRSAGNICAKPSDCASNLCVAVGPVRHVCGCRTAADCPPSPDSTRPVVFCDPAVKTCSYGLANGTPCGEVDSGLRLCEGVCPSPTCVSRIGSGEGTCCADTTDCAARCCTGRGATGCNSCGGGYCCAGSALCQPGPCGRDSDCPSDKCVCGTCVVDVKFCS